MLELIEPAALVVLVAIYLKVREGVAIMAELILVTQRRILK